MKHLHSSQSSAIRRRHRGVRLPGRDFPGQEGDTLAVTPRWHCGVMGMLSRVTQAQQHTSLCFGPGTPDLLVVCTVPTWSCCFRQRAGRPLLSPWSLHPLGLCLWLLQPCKPMGHKYLVNLFCIMSPAMGRLLWKEHWTITKHDLPAMLSPTSSFTRCQHIKYGPIP